MPKTLFLELQTSNFGYSHVFLSQEKWWGQILPKLTFKNWKRHISANIGQQKFSLGTVPTPNLAVCGRILMKFSE